MNNNRCVICGAIIPEGRQVCPLCERKASKRKTEREVISVYSVTPENKFCFECKKKKCNGECREYKEYLAGLRKKGNGKIKRRRPSSD